MESRPSPSLGLLLALLSVAACHGTEPARSAVALAASEQTNVRYPVVVEGPELRASIASGELDVNGQLIEVRCATCHALGSATRAALPLRTGPEDFHEGLTLTHGTLSCQACHQPPLYESLALAGAEDVPFSETMSLCRQCHGPQTRDYDHGSHGGMAGYWDLSRGPRVRNHCVSCHDPHAPAFPRMLPASGPRDRFLTQGASAHE